MSAPLWVAEAAEGFWAAAGGPEPYPRSLRRAIANAVPLAVTFLPRLRVSAIDVWLRQTGVVCDGLRVPDRPLRACLVARFGQGLLFVEGTDPEDEERFSLAHELAHFLRHYLQRRQKAGDALGEAILEVLDGLRPARLDERAHALLAGMQIGHYVHLMDRTAEGGAATAGIDMAEDEADLLAYELLAPAEAIMATLEQMPPADRRAEAATLLRELYGVPAARARRYAARLAPRPAGADSFLRRLRAVP